MLILVFVVFYLVFYTSAKPVEESFIIKMSNKTNKRVPRLADISFPDEDDNLFSSVVLPRLDNAPSCAEDTTFCENFKDYPHHYVKNVLEDHAVDTNLFGMDVVPEFGTRDGSSDNYLCMSRVRTIFPKVGKNIRNDWKIIINQGNEDGYVQGVVIETCMGKGKQCDLLGDLLSDYTTTCKQKYIYRRLLSINEHGKPVQDTFMLPSACCCSYRKTFDFMSRMGT